MRLQCMGRETLTVLNFIFFCSNLDMPTARYYKPNDFLEGAGNAERRDLTIGRGKQSAKERIEFLTTGRDYTGHRRPSC